LPALIINNGKNNGHNTWPAHPLSWSVEYLEKTLSFTPKHSPVIQENWRSMPEESEATTASHRKDIQLHN
jgi:hypothetical protein